MKSGVLKHLPADERIRHVVQRPVHCGKDLRVQSQRAMRQRPRLRPFDHSAHDAEPRAVRRLTCPLISDHGSGV